MKDVPVIRLSHLDEAERRVYRIADNKLTELGEWDEAMLRDEIAGLLAEDFDLSLLWITAATNSALYTAAQKIADWGILLDPGSSPDLRICQISALIGRGAARSVTLCF